MMNKRVHERSLTLKTAKILPDRATAAIDCAVLNISEGGCCILAVHDGKIPDVFDLAIDHEDSLRACNVVWRNGDRLGVSFK